MLESGLAVGSIVGVIAFGIIVKKLKLDRILLSAFLLLGSAIVLMSFNLHIYVVLISVLFIGISVVWANVIISSQVMASIPDVFRSRIGASLGFMGKGIEPVSLSVVGLSVENLGFNTSLLVLGIIALIIAPTLYLIPNFKIFMRLKSKETSVFLLEKYPVLENIMTQNLELKKEQEKKNIKPNCVTETGEA